MGPRHGYFLKSSSDECSFGAEKCSPTRAYADLTSSPAIDLCAEGTHGCEHHCISSPGSYFCRCRAGFVLQQDQRSCRGKRAPPLASWTEVPDGSNQKRHLAVSLPSHQPLTTAALGTTAASMSVLAPSLGHGATAERATTCCPMGGAVRVRSRLLYLCRGARDLGWQSPP